MSDPRAAEESRLSAAYDASREPPHELVVDDELPGRGLPHPHALEHYEQVLPGLANRIASTAERLAEHRMDMDRRRAETIDHAVREEAAAVTRGQNRAFAVAVLGILTGGILVLADHDWAGGVIGSVPLVGILVAFLKGGLTKHTTRLPEPKATEFTPTSSAE